MKLIRFLMKMTNEFITAELKNGSTISGTIISIDSKMNIHLKLVKFKEKGKQEINLDNYSIRGNHVRHIVLPDYLPIDALLIDDEPTIAKKKDSKLSSINKKIKKPKRIIRNIN